jgi:hypothetical protein
MLRFFRQLRQRLLTDNKFSKYLLYAIGEILLVVIGILIALQIDNWNEEVQNRKIEQSFYKDILSDLKKDSLKLDGLTLLYNNRIEHAGWLLKRVRDPGIPLDYIEVGKRIQPLYFGPLPVTYNSSYEAAKSSDAFARFKNKVILKDLNQFYTDFEELKGIQQATLRWLESDLEPVMSTLPENYITEDSGEYAITSELYSIRDFFKFIASIEDKRNLPVDLGPLLQNPRFETYLTGELGRSFNALESLRRRKERIEKLKAEINRYLNTPNPS